MGPIVSASKLLMAGEHLSALILAYCTIDIFAAAVSPDKRVGKRFVEWIRRWMRHDDLGCTPEELYSTISICPANSPAHARSCSIRGGGFGRRGNGGGCGVMRGLPAPALAFRPR